MWKTQVSISDKRKILPYFILKKVITEKLFLHQCPINRKDNTGIQKKTLQKTTFFELFQICQLILNVSRLMN